MKHDCEYARGNPNPQTSRTSLQTARRAVLCMAILNAVACGEDAPASTPAAAREGGAAGNASNASNATRAPAAGATVASNDPRPAGSGAVAGTAAAAGRGTTAEAGATTEAGAAAGAGAGGSSGSSQPLPVAGTTGATSMPDAVCNASDQRGAPQPASFTQIRGYEKLTKEPTTGPERPVLESDPGLPEWTVYRPERLESATKRPILLWANGGCLKNGTIYGQFLLEVASHGIVAIADGAPQAQGADPIAGGIRMGGADGKPMQMALDWITAENERPCSPYYRKLDVSRVAVAGQSCGGMMAEYASVDPRVTTAIINNSGLFTRDAALYPKMHAPMAFFIGGMSDIAYANAEADMAAINGVPIFNGNLDVGHAATWEETNGGEFGRVALGWLKWKLKADPAAEKMFAGADCELCTPPSKWVVKKKMMD